MSGLSHHSNFYMKEQFNMENLTKEQVDEFLASDAAQQIIAEGVQAAISETKDKYEDKLKALNDEKERLQLEKMTEEERTQHELKKYKDKIEEQKTRIRQIALEGRATQLLTQYSLPLEAMELIASDDEITLVKRATLLSRLISTSAKQQQQQSAYSSFNSTEKNPWSKENFNLTEQGRLFRDNPEKACQMAAQHGIKL